MKLTDVDEGKYKVVKIKTGRGAKMRLAAIGVLPGTIIINHSQSKHLPCVVEVKGSKIVLGKKLTDKIEVEQCS